MDSEIKRKPVEEGKTNSRLKQRMGQYLLIQMSGFFSYFNCDLPKEWKINLGYNCSTYLCIPNLSKTKQNQNPKPNNQHTNQNTLQNYTIQLQKPAAKSTAVAFLIQ